MAMNATLVTMAEEGLIDAATANEFCDTHAALCIPEDSLVDKIVKRLFPGTEKHPDMVRCHYKVVRMIDPEPKPSHI